VCFWKIYICIHIIKYLVDFNKRSLSNILSIFTNFLYQISCPFLQTFFIKYHVHFNKHSLSNILSNFTNVLYQICCPFLQPFFIKYLVHFNKPLCCLFFFDIRILITLLVSSNFLKYQYSFIWKYKKMIINIGKSFHAFVQI
jgi:hypothetical protein